MNILKLGLALASALGVVTFGPLNRPSVAQSTAPVAAQSTVPVAAQTNQSQVWSYQLDTATLNQYVNAWAGAQGALQTPLGTARLRQLNTEIRDNELIVSGTADAGWLSVPVDAAATASVESGSVLVHLVRAHINGVDVPDGPRAQIEQQLQSQLSQPLSAYHVSVRSVQLADGKLVISGTRF